MSKVFKATIYLTDPNGELEDKEDFKEYLKDELEDGYYLFFIEMEGVEESEEFEWDDDLAINSTDATIDDYKAYLK